MKIYIISLATGILMGEQAITVGQQILAGRPWKTACASHKTVSHVLGELPGRNTGKKSDENE